MRIRVVALGAAFALVGLCCGVPPAAAATAGHGGWTTEQLWGPHNDWEPNVAADPSSSWLYQMTTQYGGHRVCRPKMNHCILFRSGASWSSTVRLSNRGSGAPYKSRTGFRFPYGDYFGITVDSHGTSYLAWSEGTNYDGPGSTWWAHNH
jgi:hypothetical protein